MWTSNCGNDHCSIEFRSFFDRSLCIGSNGSRENHAAASFSSVPRPYSGISRLCLVLCDCGVQATQLCLTYLSSVPSEANFSITTLSVMKQYFGKFRRPPPLSGPNHAILCNLLPSKTGYHARPDRRDDKIPELLDLHIRRQQMPLNSLIGAMDKVLMSFICLPDQLDRAYAFTRLGLLSNVVGRLRVSRCPHGRTCSAEGGNDSNEADPTPAPEIAGRSGGSSCLEGRPSEGPASGISPPSNVTLPLRSRGL
jgi:hypothetical protein